MRWRNKALCSETGNSENKMAADAILDFNAKLNNSVTIYPIVTKFELELRLGTPETTFGSKMKFFKIQDGRRAPIEIYKYGYSIETVSPKMTKFGRNHPLGTPNRRMSLKILNFQIQDGHRPPF
jgi:hypothetical protein